jgi:hypothetical protein
LAKDTAGSAKNMTIEMALSRKAYFRPVFRDREGGSCVSARRSRVDALRKVVQIYASRQLPPARSSVDIDGQVADAWFSVAQVVAAHGPSVAAHRPLRPQRKQHRSRPASGCGPTSQ